MSVPKIVACFLALLFPTSLSHSQQIDYSSFSSIEEVITYETKLIANTPSDCHEHLADAFASRGESLLLCMRLGEALEDFQKSYDFSQALSDQTLAAPLIVRALFGQAFVYANLNEAEVVDAISEEIRSIFAIFKCPNKAKSYYANSENVPIYGPEDISIQDCIDLVNNTVSYSKLLICKSSPSIRATLTLIIEQLADEARKCCKAGGLWKGCFQKLANKYHQWNQKWNAFGIPPDPSWD